MVYGKYIEYATYVPRGFPLYQHANMTIETKGTSGGECQRCHRSQKEEGYCCSATCAERYAHQLRPDITNPQY